MLTAATLLWLNIDSRMTHAEMAEIVDDIYQPPLPALPLRGWPMIAYPTLVPPVPMIVHRWNQEALAIDAAVALAVLVAVGIVSEFIARRAKT